MKLPMIPHAASSVSGLMDWTRQLTSSIVAGWVAEHKSDGTHDWHWTDIVYDAKRFTGSDAMTWGVGSDDQGVYRYGVLGDMLALSFRILNTDVAGTPSTELRIALPNGYAASGDWSGGILALDAGTYSAGVARVENSDRVVRLYNGAAAAWTATAADNTSVYGSIYLRVTKD